MKVNKQLNRKGFFLISKKEKHSLLRGLGGTLHGCSPGGSRWSLWFDLQDTQTQKKNERKTNVSSNSSCHIFFVLQSHEITFASSSGLHTFGFLVSLQPCAKTKNALECIEPESGVEALAKCV